MKMFISLLLSVSIASAQNATCNVGGELCRFYMGKASIPGTPAQIDLGGRCQQSATPNDFEKMASSKGYCRTGAVIYEMPGMQWVGVNMYNPQTHDHITVEIGRYDQDTYVRALHDGDDGLMVTLKSDDQRLGTSLDEGLAREAREGSGGGSLINNIPPEVMKNAATALDAYFNAQQAQESMRRQEDAYQRETTYRIDKQREITVAYQQAADQKQVGIGLVLGSLASQLSPVQTSTIDPTDASITIDDPTQLQAAQVAIENKSKKNWKGVARNVNGLFDPRLTSVNPQARAALAPIVDSDGLVKGPVIGKMIPVPNESLKANMRIAANWVQAGALTQGRLLETPDRRSWLRAGVNAYRAGEIALAQGRTDDGLKLLDRARKIGQALAGSEERNQLDTPDDLRLLMSRGNDGDTALRNSYGGFSNAPSKSYVDWTPDAIAYAGRFKQEFDFLQGRADRFSEFLFLTPKASNALGEIMQSILRAANYKLSARDLEGLTFLAEVGLKVFDVSTYFTPTHLIADIYGVVKGVDFQTGRLLTEEERLMSMVNIAVSLKISANSVLSLTRLEANAAANADRAANAHLEKMFGEVKFTTAEKVNAEHIGMKPPYLPGTVVAETTLTSEVKNLVRVHTTEDAGGRWLAEAESIRGLSPEQIQRELSLPSVPVYISDVEIVGPVDVYRGVINENFGGHSGAIQYEIKLGQGHDLVRFKNTRKL